LQTQGNGNQTRRHYRTARIQRTRVLRHGQGESTDIEWTQGTQEYIITHIFSRLFVQKVVKSEAEQTFLRAVLDSDFDQSNEFSDQEVQMLEYRLRNVPGMTINQEMLKTKVKASDRSLASVLQLLSELYNDDIKDEERIFQIHEEELLKK